MRRPEMKRKDWRGEEEDAMFRELSELLEKAMKIAVVLRDKADSKGGWRDASEMQERLDDIVDAYRGR